MDFKTHISERMHLSTHLKFEIIAIIIPSFFLTFLISTLSSHIHTNFIFEFVLFVIPLVLNYTLFASYIHEFIFTLIVMCMSFTIFTMNCKQESLIQTKKIAMKHVPFVTNVRSIINLITCISILAVDFEIYPQRFEKTNTYGFSLMDLGVGLFIYSNGIVAPEIGSKKSLSNIVKNAMPLLGLGVLRLILTRLLKYNVPIIEYGTDWNFFFTLFAVKLLASLIMSFVGNKYALINAISLLFAYEIFLQMGLAKYVIGATPRDNFFRANREGIISSLGYVALYFLAVYIGKELNLKATKTLQEKFKLFKKLLVFSALLFFSTVYSEKSFGVSRRLANTGYCIWTMFIGVFMTGLFCLGEIIQQYMFENKGYYKAKYVPYILETINYNGLVFFLTSNVLTGLVNIIINTKNYDTLPSLIIIALYMFLTCFLNSILYKKGIKIKI